MYFQGGVLDLVDSARSILRDWRVGKFPYYSSPPPSSSSSAIASIEQGLSAVYIRTDDSALADTRSRKEMRAQGGLIRMTPSPVDSREVILDAPVQPVAPVTSLKQTKSKVTKAAKSLAGAAESEDEAESSEDDDEQEDDAEIDEEEEDVEDVEEEPSAPISSKRKRAAAKADGPPSKKVSFAPKAAKSKADKQPATKVKANAKAKLPLKVSNVGKGAKAPVATGDGASEAYDFKQFF